MASKSGLGGGGPSEKSIPAPILTYAQVASGKQGATKGATKSTSTEAATSNGLDTNNTNEDSDPKTSTAECSDAPTVDSSASVATTLRSDHRLLKPATQTPSRETILTNFFRLKLNSNTQLHQYAIKTITKVPKAETEEKTDPQKPDPPPKPKAVRCPLQNFKGPRADKAHQKKVEAWKEARERKQVKGKDDASSDPKPEDGGDGTHSRRRRVQLPARVLRRLIFLLIDDIRIGSNKQNKNIGIATDYKSTLVTTAQIEHPDVPGTCRVTFYDEDENGPCAWSPQYDVEIGYFLNNNPLYLSELADHVRHLGNGQHFSQTQHYLTKSAAEAAIEVLQNPLNLLYSHRPNRHTLRTPLLLPSIAFVGANKFYPLSWPSYSPARLSQNLPPGSDGRQVQNVQQVGYNAPWGHNQRGRNNQRGGYGWRGGSAHRGGPYQAKSVPLPPWRVEKEKYLQAIPGFFRSVRNALGSETLLNINTTTSAFYLPGNLLTLLQHFGLNKPLWKIASFIKGLRVQTTYMLGCAHCNQTHQAKGTGFPAAERVHTIRGLPFDDLSPWASNVFFKRYANDEDEVGEYITVQQYWADSHGIGLADQDLIIDCGRGGCIPAKHLSVLPGQALKQKTEMVDFACRLPRENYSLIMNEGMATFGINPRDHAHGPLAAFGLDLNTSMLRIQPAKLSAGPISYRNRSGLMVVDDHELSKGRWNLKSRSCAVASPGQGWTFIELVRGQQVGCTEAVLRKFANSFHHYLNNLGLYSFTGWNMWGDIGQHKVQIPLPINGASDEEVTETKDIIRDWLEECKVGANIVIVLLPDQDSALYGMVKTAGDLEVGVHTICHVCRPGFDKITFKPVGEAEAFPAINQYWGPKMDPGTIANLHMKFNLKLGPGQDVQSANQVFKNLDGINSILTDKTMIVGMDVTHPGTTSLREAPSVAAVVASVDFNFAQWPASLQQNQRPEPDSGQSMERIEQLDRMIKQRLKRFLDVRSHLPDRIIVYRDGLSEAQFEMCKTVELPQIKKAITEIYSEKDSPEPPVLLICAVKRHHARFFPDDESGSSRNLVDDNGNPRPGTAVFNSITYGQNADFYLVSHEAIKGTARPTHYVVLHNELAGANIGDIATMTHRLCYLFGRATRSVGVVPAAYYADLAADRARHYVRDVYLPANPDTFDPMVHNFPLTLHPVLAETMFYI